jgi:hypothetical protein
MARQGQYYAMASIQPFDENLVDLGCEDWQFGK